MKTLEVKAAALWLDERKADSRIESSHPALLRLPSLEVHPTYHHIFITGRMWLNTVFQRNVHIGTW